MISCSKQKKNSCKSPCAWTVGKGCRIEQEEKVRKQVKKVKPARRLAPPKPSTPYFTPTTNQNPSPVYHTPVSSVASYKTPQEPFYTPYKTPEEPNGIPNPDETKAYVGLLWQKLKRASDQRTMQQRDIFMLWEKLKMCNQRAKENEAAAVYYANLAQTYANEIKEVKVAMETRIAEVARRNKK